MKIHYRISLISVALAVLLSIILTIAIDTDPEVVLVALGVVSSIIATLAFFIALVLLIANSQEYSKAFFITSGIMLLIGIGVCGPMLLGVGNNF